MLGGQGVTKRGETIAQSSPGNTHDSAGGSGSHHAAVHSILQSRRKSSLNRGGPLSNSGSRILPLRRTVSASPMSRSNGATVAVFPADSSMSSLVAPPAATTTASDQSNNKEGADNNEASSQQPTEPNEGQQQVAQQGENKNEKQEQQVDKDENDQGQEFDEENELRKRHVEQQLSAALNEERKRSQSLSRKLLGRRGRSQQPRGRTDSSQEASQLGTGRSLSTSHLREDGIIQNDNPTNHTTTSAIISQSVKLNIIRQDNSPNPAENAQTSITNSPHHPTNISSLTKHLLSPSDDISHASSSSKSSSSSTVKNSKSKKLWKAMMKGGWKKKHKDHEQQGDKIHSTDNVDVAANHLNDSPYTCSTTVTSSPLTAMAAENATSATTLPPSAPPFGSGASNWDDIASCATLEEEEEGDLIMGNPLGGDDGDDHDAPWMPTMSMLLQTGQLDCIESDSDEDREESSSSINMSYHTEDSNNTTRGRRGGDFENSRRGEDFDTSDHHLGNNDGTYDQIDDNGFPVSHYSRLNDDDSVSRSPGGFDVDDFMGLGVENADDQDDFFNQVANSYLSTVRRMSGNDESTLSKADTEDLSGRSKNRKKSLEREKQQNKQPSTNGEKRRNLSIRSLSESIARRGRSRGRQKKKEQANYQRTDTTAIESSSSNNTGNEEMASTSSKKDDTESVISAQPSISASTDSSSGRRSRSVFRRRHMNILRKSSTKTQDEQPPKRMSSLDIADSRHPSTKSPKRNTKSLPRRISHTPSTRDSFNDSCSASSSTNFDYCSSTNFDYSDFSLNQRRKQRRKKCLVCRQNIPRGESIKYMDFYFCSSAGCYACVSCRKPLSKDEEDDLQIISNARGSVVQCGECAGKGMILRPTVPSLDEEAEETQSIHLDDSYREGEAMESSCPVSSGLGGGDHLMAAVKRLAEKASVKLSLANGSTDEDEEHNKHLSTLFFMQNEESKQTNKRSAPELTTKLIYELDSDAFGNPNYDGYSCSINNFDDVETTPRMITVALPKLRSDEIDGSISKELEVDLQWVDDDDESECSNGSNNGVGGIQPRRLGPAMLSIELFKSEAIDKETVMKVLRQTWEYEEHNVTYNFSFVVPFKKIYISWEIDEGDELDLTQCQLEVTVEYDPPKEEPEVKQPEEAMTNKNLGSSRIVVNNEKDDGCEASSSENSGSKPKEVYVKQLSIDHTALSSTSAGGFCPSSSLILSRKGELDPDRGENDNFSELLSVASCTNPIIALPSIVYIKIEKENFECEVGLSLIEKNGATVVAEVSKSGLFADSQIKEGCEILAINGQCVRGPRSVMRIMKDITGKVLIMVSDSPSPPGARFVVKKHRSTGFGRKADPGSQDITFQTINGLVSVKDIAENGIFSESPISKGDICLSVDGVPAVSDDVATRALRRSQSIVAMLMFSLPGFWKSIVEFIIDEKFNRWWKQDSVCTLLWGNEDCTPITLSFDESGTGLCKAEGNEENEVDLRDMNIIIDRVMKLLTESIKAYRSDPKKRLRDSSRSLSVSASGKMKNRSDVYRRALIKLDVLRENGTLSAKDYEAGRNALAQVAIQTAK